MSSTSKTSKLAREVRLDAVFNALSDSTRRSILAELAKGPRLVGEIAEPFSMSLPAICKHLDVLERGGLIRRERDGRLSRCYLEVQPLETAAEFLDHYRAFWSDTLDSMAAYVEESVHKRPPKKGSA